MLKIENLHATINEKKILSGINLQVKAGEVHAIMGPNGAGKSTLSKVIAGYDKYIINEGKIYYKDLDLEGISIEERACKGIFVSFQYPVEIPGINNAYFLRTAYNAIRKYRNEKELDAVDFLKILKQETKKLNIKDEFINRSLNTGFSGGEKKKNEILQLNILNPDLAILDETDSGLDIDSLKIVADGVNRFKAENKSVILVTHYQRLLDYIIPDYVHVLINGAIVKTGGKELAIELEKTGYNM